MIKNNLANFLTLLNLLSGVFALYFVFESEYDWAFYLVLLGITFDFIDGLVARTTHTSSELGLQLDSMADLITSGLVPAFFIFKIWHTFLPDSSVPYLAFLIPVASAWRLARFNLDTRQKEHFIGLPTPANALFLFSLGMIFLKNTGGWLTQALKEPVVLTAVILFSTLMLNAPVPLLALKFKKNDRHKNAKIFLLAVSLISIVLFSFSAVPFILLFYIIFSMFVFKLKKG